MDTPPPIPGQPAPKKSGLSKLACAGIGCGAIIVGGGLILLILSAFLLPTITKTITDFSENPEKAAAELLVGLNDSVELVESDPEAGTVTVRIIKSGEVVTIPYANFMDENFSITDAVGNLVVQGGEAGNVEINSGDAQVVTREGESALEIAPDWVAPFIQLPGMTVTSGVRASADGEGTFGTTTLETAATIQQTAASYKAALESAGFQVSESPSPDFKTITLSTQMPEGMLTIECLAEESGSSVAVSYNTAPLQP